LRATIGWSYDLLDPAAQQLFRQLAVFVGGGTLEAVEAVCGRRAPGVQRWEAGAADPTAVSQPTIAILDGLATLVDQSLVRQVAGTGGAPRFVMLETIREYALERLAEQGEVDLLRRQHAAWYLALAQAAEPELTGPRQQDWLERLEQEHSNLCAAIQSALDQQENQTALELCAALWKFWQFHSRYSVGQQWMEATLARSSALKSRLRAEVLCGAGWLAFSAVNNDRAQTLFGESLALARALQEPRDTAMALHGVGQMAQLRGDYAQARALYEESLALFRELSDSEEIAWSLHHLGKLACQQGDNAAAMALFEECLALFRNIGHGWGIALALRHLGYIAYLRGDVALATAYYQEALELSQDLGDTASSVWTRGCLAEMAAAQGERARAAALCVESLRIARERGDNEGISWFFAGLMRLATAQRSAEQRAQFLGAMDALLDQLDIRLSPAEQAEWEHQVAGIHPQLAETPSGLAWARGRAMTVEQVASSDSQGAGLSIAARPLPPPP
jgi:tetratricopeptide (TPR) repeat protein